MADILANLVTPQQLDNYATQTLGTDRLNQDQWCYIVAKLTGTSCPAYDVGNPPDVLTSSDDFLTGLRNFLLGLNAVTQGPGGSGGTPAAALGGVGSTNTPPPVATGIGLFGATNCQFCIWLKQNLALAAAVTAVAIYFGFFYKK